MTEPLECFLCIRPCAQVYENQYQRMPCMTATEIANPTNEVYMRDERYINFANFLAKFQKNRKENDEVRRRRLSYKAFFGTDFHTLEHMVLHIRNILKVLSLHFVENLQISFQSVKETYFCRILYILEHVQTQAA